VEDGGSSGGAGTTLFMPSLASYLCGATITGSSISPMPVRTTFDYKAMMKLPSAKPTEATGNSCWECRLA